MLMLAPRYCAGERHSALITADLFAVSLGQRDIEHQDEHVTGSPSYHMKNESLFDAVWTAA
jgi:hypothetical protein